MKKEKYKNIVKFILSFVILVLQVSIWGFVWMQYFASDILRPFGYKGNWLVIAVYAAIMLLFTSFYGGYQIGYHNGDDLFLSGVISLIIANALTYLQSALIGRELLAATPFLVMTVVQAVLIWVWSKFVSFLFNQIFPPYKMLLVYGGEDLARSLIKKMSIRTEKYIICEAVSIYDEKVDALASIEKYEAIILCDLPTTERNKYLKFCFERGKRIYTTPKISDILMRGAINNELFDTPLLLNKDEALTPEQRTIKRFFDVLISGVALIALSPLMIITALFIKLYDRGPVLYKQTRLTLNNQEFSVYKFRSMVIDAEKHTGAKLAAENDNRITPIGKFIRAVRLDELPQLWNIFKGDMSIVGPRPERPELAKEYQKTMPEFHYRLKVKAGLTGYAQVYGKYNTTPYDKLKLDLIYISGFSLFTDFRIILMTIKIIFKKESTEGTAL